MIAHLLWFFYFFCHTHFEPELPCIFVCNRLFVLDLLNKFSAATFRGSVVENHPCKLKSLTKTLLLAVVFLLVLEMGHQYACKTHTHTHTSARTRILCAHTFCFSVYQCKVTIYMMNSDFRQGLPCIFVRSSSFLFILLMKI